MIATKVELDDLVPVQKTFVVNGEVHLGTEVTADAPGGFALQVPAGQTAVWLGATGVSASAADDECGLEIPAGTGGAAGAIVPLANRSLRGWYVTGTSTRLTVVAFVARSS